MDTKSLRLRLIVLQIISFAAYASMNYYTILLQTTGFTASQIGLWSSIGCIVALVTLPVWGIISDRTNNIRFTFVLSMIIYAAVFLVFPKMAQWWKAGIVIPIYVMISLYYLVKQPTHSLQDAWFISVCEPKDIPYASLRMWGSLGFGITAIGTGFIADYFSIDLIFVLPAIFILLMIVIILRMKDTRPAARKVQQKANLSGLFKNYYYTTALLAVFALAFYMAVTSAFYGFILTHANVDPERYGLFSGYGAILQCLVIFIVGKLEKKIPRPYLLIAAGLIVAAENLLYSVADGMLMMFLCATLWGVEMSINVSTLPKYVYTLVPTEYQATAQTVSGTCCMILAVLGNFFGGLVVDNLGIDGLNRIVATCALALTALFAFTLFFGIKVLKKPKPWANQF